MARTIILGNSLYLDTSSIVHDGTKLDEVILKNKAKVNGFNGRISSLKFADRDTYKNSVRHDLLSSSISGMTDKPGEGFVDSYFWDVAGWDTQIFVPNNSAYSPHIRYRNASEDGGWENWIKFATSANDLSVYDTGYNSSGRWIRFNNGYMICSNRVHNVPVHLEASLSGRNILYYGYNDNWASYPQTFAEEPTCLLNINTGSNVFCIQPYQKGSTTKPPGFYPMGVDNGLQGTITVSYIACGRWK